MRRDAFWTVWDVWIIFSNVDSGDGLEVVGKCLMRCDMLLKRPETGFVAEDSAQFYIS